MAAFTYLVGTTESASLRHMFFSERQTAKILQRAEEIDRKFAAGNPKAASEAPPGDPAINEILRTS